LYLVIEKPAIALVQITATNLRPTIVAYDKEILLARAKEYIQVFYTILSLA
jgi:hypothetical protein